MKVFVFVFSFLFIRNWHTGEMELSRPRVILFAGMLTIVLLGLAIAYILHTPLTYTNKL